MSASLEAVVTIALEGPAGQTREVASGGRVFAQAME